MNSSHKKLKQPKKYTHSSLNQNENDSEKEQNVQDNQFKQSNMPKSKPIAKQPKQTASLPNKKTINKKNEPSAIRLQAINETFHKLQRNAETMMAQFRVDNDLLNKLLHYSNKTKCKCNRNIKYYCLKCLTANPQAKAPKVDLPLSVHILHHSSQNINKSSIVPMCLLSDCISMSSFNSETSPEQLAQGMKKMPIDQTVILFPHKQARKIAQFQATQFKQIKHVVVLDCTWFQTDQIINCLHQIGYHIFVRLQDYESVFWRYNHHNEKALSSGQAIVYFMRQFQSKLAQIGKQNADDGMVKKYDGIMFYYLLNLKIVQMSYKKTGPKQIQKQKQESQQGGQK